MPKSELTRDHVRHFLANCEAYDPDEEMPISRDNLSDLCRAFLEAERLREAVTDSAILAEIGGEVRRRNRVTDEAGTISKACEAGAIAIVVESLRASGFEIVRRAALSKE